jgi:uncharacterized protein YoxC
MILLGIGTAIILVALLIQVNILQHRVKEHERKMITLAESLYSVMNSTEDLIEAHNYLVREINQAKDEMMEMDNIDNILPLDLTNSMGLA